MLRRLREKLEEIDERETREYREHAEFFERQVHAGAAQVARHLRTIDRRTLIALGCVGVGAALALAGATIPAVGDVGSGYFIRAGILLGGVGLTMLLRPS